MSRYDQLIAICGINRPQKIVEVGTWNGDRAIQMIHAAGAKEYVGYDLFEEATDETDAEESNVKPHFAMDEVGHKIKAACPDCEVTLIGGNTRETLHGKEVVADLAFIDGGHSAETVLGDWEALKGSKIVVLDDYYEGREGGCNFLVDDAFEVMPLKDPVQGGGSVKMAVTRGFAPPTRLQVKTRNCVPDEVIVRNVQSAIARGLPEFEIARKHNRTAAICAGGPSLDPSKIPADAVVFCVKSAHDKLIEAGVIPWACVLLDPRAHVADFVENPHPDIRYFVASMCDPTTFDALKGHKVWVYHALVGAGEDKVLSGRKLLAGGCSAGVRAISLAHALGFRSFELFGFDLCYRDESETSTLAPEKIRVNIDAREIVMDPRGEYLTDLEKMAQAQELKALFKSDCDFTVHSEILAKLQPPPPATQFEDYA